MDVFFNSILTRLQEIFDLGDLGKNSLMA